MPHYVNLKMYVGNPQLKKFINFSRAENSFIDLTLKKPDISLSEIHISYLYALFPPYTN